MDYKISMIIPVYNAEKTLKRAIDSVINQDFGFNNIELIIVDDNSSDSSKKIIMEYSNQYDNIIPIFLNENHGGPAIPRNIGMKHATSEYMMFLDNDDALMSDYCKTLYSVINKENCDVVNCRYSSKLLDGIYAPSFSSKEYIIINDRFSLGFPMWANIFRTNFIQKHNIICPNTLSEDGNFTIRAYTKADNVIQLPNYYGYIHTVESDEIQSLGHTVNNETFNRTIEGYNLTLDYFNENDFDKSKLFNNKIPNILFLFFNFTGSKSEKINILKKVRDFELGLDYPIKLNSIPLNIINNLILNEHYNLAILFSFFANKLYNQRKIKNFIYKRFFGIKKINLK